MAEKILILGGRGFVGSYLAEYLKPHFSVDVTSTLGGNNTREFDIRKNDYSILDDYERIINCIVSYATDSNTCIDVNVKGPLSLLEYLQNRACHYINISSLSALDENFHQSNYALTKHLGDIAVRFFERRPPVKVVTLRFAQVYDAIGKARKIQPGLFFFAEQIKNRDPLTVFGDGLKKRSYIPVEIVCKCILHCLKKEIVGEHNIIMKDGYSPLELIEIFSKCTSYDLQKVRFDREKSVVTYEIPDCSGEFVSVLEGESNLPYLEKLFNNV